MAREIKQTSAYCAVADAQPSDPIAGMVQQLGGASAYVLAHAWDGVTWGRIQNGQLTPSIPLETLQELRVFNDSVEGLLWREGAGWRVRWLGEALPTGADGASHYDECIDEGYLLWGTEAKEADNGFSELRDGAQGLCHVVPLALDKLNLPLRLIVRHYLKADDDGQVVVDLSRLVTLRPNPSKSE